MFKILLGEWETVDADHSAASDLGLHCLLRPVCPNTWDYYGKPFLLAHLNNINGELFSALASALAVALVSASTNIKVFLKVLRSHHFLTLSPI